MLKMLFRVFLAFSSTMWMIIVYAIKTQYTVFGWSRVLCAIIYIGFGIVIAMIVLVSTQALEKDELIKCAEFSLADNEFVESVK